MWAYETVGLTNRIDLCTQYLLVTVTCILKIVRIENLLISNLSILFRPQILVILKIFEIIVETRTKEESYMYLIVLAYFLAICETQWKNEFSLWMNSETCEGKEAETYLYM